MSLQNKEFWLKEARKWVKIYKDRKSEYIDYRWGSEYDYVKKCVLFGRVGNKRSRMFWIECNKLRKSMLLAKQNAKKSSFNYTILRK